MDYRNILAFAAVIFAAGYFVRSFQPAYAFPQGPNVSIGSNPIDDISGLCNQTDFFTNSTNQAFIITDIIGETEGGHNLTLQINGSAVSKLFSSTENVFYALQSGIIVEPGENVRCSGSNARRIFISGYYTH